MTPAEIMKLYRADVSYGIASIIVFGGGLLLAFAVGKPSAFYMENWVFQLKGWLYLVLGALSIKPTAFFMKNRKSEEEIIAVPKSVFILIRYEMALIVFMPVLAVLMARGYGL